MKRLPKIFMIIVFSLGFLYSLIANTPAWIVGALANHYSQKHLDTTNEYGNFWNGHAMLIAQDANSNKTVPLIMIGWNIKLGLKKFVSVNFSAANKTIANVALTKSGLQLTNLDLSLSLDQLAPLLGNMNSLSLSGNVHVKGDNITLAKKSQGTINVSLEDVGSGISPVNPIGSYQIALNLANQSLDVNSDSSSTISVSGSGNLNSLVLNSRVQEAKREKLLQFMTMMGIPQSDGSYQMKVF